MSNRYSLVPQPQHLAKKFNYCRRNSLCAFQWAYRGLRETSYVAHKIPKRAENAKRPFSVCNCSSKLKKVCYRVSLCDSLIPVSDKVVRHSQAYPSAKKWFAEDIRHYSSPCGDVYHSGHSKSHWTELIWSPAIRHSGPKLTFITSIFNQYSLVAHQL